MNKKKMNYLIDEICNLLQKHGASPHDGQRALTAISLPRREMMDGPNGNFLAFNRSMGHYESVR